MSIKRDDTCASCAVKLPAGTTAIWYADERVVRCRSCGDDRTQVNGDEAVLREGASHDVAGASAQSEYVKRSARELARQHERVAADVTWRSSIKADRPILGRIAAAVTPKPVVGPEPQATQAWRVGAEGERRVAEVLAGVAGVEVLHSRLRPGSRADIDHIVVGPAGVFVIDAKKYAGKVEVRDVGGLFRSDERLYVNNRDRTSLVDGVLRQVQVVRAVLGEEHDDVAIRGVLCFVGCEWGIVMRQKRIREVTALWPDALVAHVTAGGELGGRIPLVADHLRRRLRPAT